jgi:hypothetical protein
MEQYLDIYMTNEIDQTLTFDGIFTCLQQAREMTCFQLLQKVNYEQIKGEMGGFFSFPKRWHFIKALRGIAQ